jgi:hypothetical protein
MNTPLKAKPATLLYRQWSTAQGLVGVTDHSDITTFTGTHARQPLVYPCPPLREPCLLRSRRITAHYGNRLVTQKLGIISQSVGNTRSHYHGGNYGNNKK